MSNIENTEIASAADVLVAARAAVDTAVAKVRDTVAHRDNVAGRIAALGDERARIVAGLRNGGDHATGGARLAVIDADKADLGPLHRSAQDAVHEAQAAAATAAQSVSMAEQRFAMAVDHAELADLTAHATKLEGLLWETLQRVGALYRSLNIPRPQWYPTPEVADLFTRLHLTRQGMSR